MDDYELDPEAAEPAAKLIEQGYPKRTRSICLTNASDRSLRDASSVPAGKCARVQLRF